MNHRLIRAGDPKVKIGSFDAFYRHGWHSWSPSGWVDPTAPVTPIPDEGRRLGHDDPTIALETTVSSSDVGVAIVADGSAILLGALAPHGRVRPDGPLLVGTSEAGPIDWLVAEGTVVDVFAEYARHLARNMGHRPRRRVTVWCSWYSYYEDITEGQLLDEIDSIGDMPFDVIQVDDGWERAVGDWDANDGFPTGMQAMADAIRATGRSAGLWMAPYIARSDSLLASERPELLLRDDDGAPVVSGINWGGPYYSLDPTADATTEFVVDLITRARSWGYDYLKLDFLYAAAFPGAHEQPMPRANAYRQALATIRGAAGDDCYLNACGAPIIASLGLVDGIRVGPDVAGFWEEPGLTAMGDFSGRGARNAIITTSERLWLKEIVDTDPDVAFFDRSTVELDEHTASALRDLAAITGFVGTSDHIGDLELAEATELRSALSSVPKVRRDGWHRWSIDGRPVDFAWAHRSLTTQPGREP